MQERKPIGIKTTSVASQLTETKFLNTMIPSKQTTGRLEKKKTKFRSRVFGRLKFWKTCTSVVNHEDMDTEFHFY